jgi:hypothetical protein
MNATNLYSSIWRPRQFSRNVLAVGFGAFVFFQFTNAVFGGLFALSTLFVLPVAAAAFLEAQTFAAGTRRSPKVPEIWRAARDMAEVYLALLAVASVVLAFSHPGFLVWLTHAPFLVVLLVYGMLTAIAFVAIRWSYALGVILTLEKTNNKTG